MPNPHRVGQVRVGEFIRVLENVKSVVISPHVQPVRRRPVQTVPALTQNFFVCLPFLEVLGGTVEVGLLGVRQVSAQEHHWGKHGGGEEAAEARQVRGAAGVLEAGDMEVRDLDHPKYVGGVGGKRVGGRGGGVAQVQTGWRQVRGAELVREGVVEDVAEEEADQAQ